MNDNLLSVKLRQKTLDETTTTTTTINNILNKITLNYNKKRGTVKQ